MEREPGRLCVLGLTRMKWCYGANTRRFFRDLRSVQKNIANPERAGIVPDPDEYMPHENVEHVAGTSK
jgi:hypothetical protein